MFCSINVACTDQIILYKTSEIMILYFNMFRSWQRIIWLRDKNETLVVFDEHEKYFWIGEINVEYKLYLFHQQHKRYYFGNRLTQGYKSCLRCTYSNFICSLPYHKRVHPTYEITYNKCDMEFSELLEYAWDQPSEKYASL